MNARRFSKDNVDTSSPIDAYYNYPVYTRFYIQCSILIKDIKASNFRRKLCKYIQMVTKQLLTGCQ